MACSFRTSQFKLGCLDTHTLRNFRQSERLLADQAPVMIDRLDETFGGISYGYSTRRESRTLCGPWDALTVAKQRHAGLFDTTATALGPAPRATTLPTAPASAASASAATPTSASASATFKDIDDVPHP